MRTSLIFIACLAISAIPGTTLSQSRTESFWRKVLRITGIAAAPSPKGGPDITPGSGDIWVFNLENESSIQISSGGGYTAPIFIASDSIILALRGDSVVKVPSSGGEPKVLLSHSSVVKLVGINRDNPNEVLVLTNNGRQVGLLSLKRHRLTRLPYNEKSDDDRKMVAHLQEWDRSYGEVRVFSNSKRGNSGNLSDVYVKRSGAEPVNISECGEVSCGQPSLSHNGHFVVFIKETP